MLRTVTQCRLLHNHSKLKWLGNTSTASTAIDEESLMLFLIIHNLVDFNLVDSAIALNTLKASLGFCTP